MLPAERKGNALAIRQNNYFEQKKALIQDETVQLKLSDNDLMIAQAGVSEKPIRLVPEKELLNNVAVASKFICRDVGIRSWDNAEVMKYDAVRFFTTLKTYYKEFTFKEVKLAFELAMVGQLDEWLPKDKNGNPDKNHYQAFSLEYVTKILNAYKSKKNNVWFKARKALPPVVKVVTKEEKEFYRKSFIQDIYNAFELYKKDGTEPAFVLSVFIKEFLAQGVITEIPKPKSIAIEKAYRLAVTSGNKEERKTISEQYHKLTGRGRTAKVGDMLLHRAQAVQNNITIRECFDEIISSKKDIKTIIK